MIQFFRTDPDAENGYSWGFVIMVAAIVLIVGSFLVQVAMGLCPVP